MRGNQSFNDTFNRMNSLRTIDIEPKKATPMIAQYLSIKKEHKDCLIFFRMGDFYELFLEDAINASKILDITLTKRGTYNGKPIPMCGVPAHSSEVYLSRLIRSGAKVAICEQSEHIINSKENQKQNLMKREVTRVITPGTLTEENILDPKNFNYLLSIYLNRDKTGLSWIDISTGDFYSKFLNFSVIKSEIKKINPKEIIIINFEGDESQLLDICEDYNFTKLDSKLTEKTCQEKITEVIGLSDNKFFNNFEKLEIISSGHLIDYIINTQKGKIPNIKKLISKNKTEQMSIDNSTIKNLEIYESSSGLKSGSLLQIIDKTQTNTGGRLLRQYLSAPFFNASKINDRLDVVEFFLDQKELYERTLNQLKSITDIERSLSRLSLLRGSPRDLGAIKETLIEISEIKKTLNIVPLPKELVKLKKNLIDSNHEIIIELKKSLVDFPPLNIREGFVKNSYNTDLEEIKKIRDNSKSHIQKLKEKYISIVGINSLKIRYNNILGYFIEVTNKVSDKMTKNLPEEYESFFIHRQSMANTKRFTTIELADLEGKIASASERIIKIETEIFAKLSTLVLSYSSALYKNASAIAEIDLFISFATNVLEKNYKRPKVDESRNFKIKGGRHPVIEEIIKSKGDSFTANDCDLDEGSRLWLITGPNMAGKSTFLRQNALIAILAQIGSFVPADSAHIGTIDRLFSRVGAGDDLARGRSTFLVEMIETAGILNSASDKSLVILDEIGRGTATFDGLSIAWASLEHLHDMNKSRTLFATHYHELTSLNNNLKNLSTYHLKIKEWNSEIIFLHTVEFGNADKSYGISVAKIAGLPKSVIKKAREILQIFESQDLKHKDKLAINEMPLFSQTDKNQDNENFTELLDIIKGIDPDRTSPKDALTKLYELKSLLESKS